MMAHSETSNTKEKDDMKRLLTSTEWGRKYNQLIMPGQRADDITAIYDEWAEHYDQDKELLTDKQQIAFKLFLQMVLKAYPDKSSDIRILDIGSGTGKLGLKLKEAGYSHIDAIDASAKMLEVSKQHNIYTNHYTFCLGDSPVPIATGSYDLLVSIGSFLRNHITEACFEELIRITKPGGKLVITMHYKVGDPSYAEKFLKKVQDLEAGGQWVIREQAHFSVESAESKAYIFYIDVICG